jgi:predicted nucleic-acid-binding protein
MVAIDTNIIVRLLTRDDEIQYKKALSLFEKYDIFIADTVILETEWVLRYAYNFEQDSICKSFKKVFGLSNIHLSNPSRIAQAIQWHEEGLDFADALHLSQCLECESLYTFDSKFSSKAAVYSKCEVLNLK